MKKYHVLTVLFLFLFLNFSNLEAKSATKAPLSEIYEPTNTYTPSKPHLIKMNAEIIHHSGLCTTNDYNGCTLADVLNDINRADDFKPEVQIKFTSDEYYTENTNATLRQRGGQSSRKAPLKSFRIKLNKKIPLWNSQRRIQLVKSFTDHSRIRNKLSFDFFSEIPNIPSLNTQFINFTITDNAQYKQGLYTQIEHIGKEYLSRRKWHKKSNLYKAEYFYFQNSPNLALDTEGKPVNKTKFEELLEIKAGKNHQALIEMLNALQDQTLDFNKDILNKYFDKNNILAWLATNILINNIDTKVHNYYLFNPYKSKKFYLIPWDYDRAWGLAQEENKELILQLPNWWFTHANWWENKLFQRFLSNPDNLTLLQTTINQIKKQYLTPEKIQEKIDSYRDIIFPVINEEPDWNTITLVGNNDPEKIAEYNRILDSFSDNVELNYQQFSGHLKDPMPFRLTDAIVNSDNHEITFSWSKSASLFKQHILYDLEIANNPSFHQNNIIETINNIPETSYILHWKHPKGTYYYRIKAKDANNPTQNWQLAWNRTIKLPTGLQAFGVTSFTVMKDGAYLSNSGSLSLSPLFFLFLYLLFILIIRSKNIKTSNLRKTLIKSNYF